jgi:hypothetical protein
MKKNQFVKLTAAGLIAFSSSAALTSAGPLPTGSIKCSSPLISKGLYPVLEWNITYPPAIEDLIIIPVSPSDPIETKVPLIATFRTIGQGVTTGANDTFVKTRGKLSLGTSPFQTVFFGTNPEVSTTPFNLAALFGSQYTGNLIPAGTKIRFGGDIWMGDLSNGADNSFQYAYNTGDGTTNVRALYDNDPMPVGFSVGGGGPSLESFLLPYLDSAGRINIGPEDVIVFMELTHNASQSTSPGYDFQDLLFLVSFKKPTP